MLISTSRTTFRSRPTGASLLGTQASRAPRRAFSGWLVGSKAPEARKTTSRRASH